MKELDSECFLQCVNPLQVGELISTDFNQVSEYVSALCVNPLQVGELISTIAAINTWVISFPMCQSPSSRGTHFYVLELHQSRAVSWQCQSPSRRGTHFYIYLTTGRFYSMLCQSPSRRGTHFYNEM